MKTQCWLAFFTILIAGCDSSEQIESLVRGSSNIEDDQIKYVDVESPSGTSREWKESWSKEVGEAIDEHSRGLVLDVVIPSSDLNSLNCPGFNDAREEDKKRFWALFFSSISLYESSFNPNTRYWEDGLNEWSEGLFQLSTSTANYHTGCGDMNSENILDPYININCAVAVMRNQMRSRGTLFPSKAYYWSVLTSSKKYKVQSFFKSQMEDLSFCQL